MVGTEAWVDESVHSVEVFVTDFIAYWRDRSTHGGGNFVLLIRGSLQSLSLYFLPHDFESAWCSVSLQNEKYVSVGFFYRPPSSREWSITLLADTMSSV